MRVAVVGRGAETRRGPTRQLKTWSRASLLFIYQESGRGSWDRPSPLISISVEQTMETRERKGTHQYAGL